MTRAVLPSMSIELDPRMASLFGSRTRALTLGTLASAGGPLTAYRIARITGTQVIKAITELRRLERAGFVEKQRGRARGTVWVISDSRLRDFLRQRIRIVWSEDWDRSVDERIRRRSRSVLPSIDLSRFVPNPTAIPNPKEFVRSPAKDRVLAAAGLRTTRHKASGR